jgi:hypothetical protein
MSNVGRHTESQQDYLHVPENEAVGAPADTDAPKRTDPIDTPRSETGDESPSSPADGDDKTVGTPYEKESVLPPARAFAVDNGTEPTTEALGPLAESSSARSPSRAGDDIIDTPNVQEAQSPDKASPTKPLDSLSPSPVQSSASAGDDVVNMPNIQEAESGQEPTAGDSCHLAGTLSAQGPAEPPSRSDVQTVAKHAALEESTDNSLPSLGMQGSESPRSPQQSEPGGHSLPIELSSDEDRPCVTRKRRISKTSPSKTKKRRRVGPVRIQQPMSTLTKHLQLKKLTYMADEAAQERCLTWSRRNHEWRDEGCNRRFGAAEVPGTLRITSLHGRLDNGIFLCMRELEGSWRAYDVVGSCRYEAEPASVKVGLSEGQIICQVIPCTLEDGDSLSECI